MVNGNRTSTAPIRIRKKKCVKCRKKKEISQFGKHDTSSDGHQSYCNSCKNQLHKKRRHVNATFRIKHHTATRVETQLGELCPESIYKNLETHLGYRIGALKRALHVDIKRREGISCRQALQDGYHIDHIRPLSSFEVIKTQELSCSIAVPEDGIIGEMPTEQVIDWDEFRKCWAISNLTLIPAAENLAKGAKY